MRASNSRSELSLLEVRNDVYVVDRFSHLSLKDGFVVEPLAPEDVNEARHLPFPDPFDCLIAGTAIRLSCPLITKDDAITGSRLLETIW